jgi:pimeloyl-ACP methyl ester carboxylesterase
MMQEASQSGYQEAFVDVAGARVYYLHAGSGRPMLLIHGLVGSSRNWRNNIDAFAQHASVYAIDLVNMGKSQRVGGLDPGLRATANRILAVMDALDLAETDIVAHSHGGAVALMLAALHPGRVRRLVLFAPANPYCRSADPVVRTYSTPGAGFSQGRCPIFRRRFSVLLSVRYMEAPTASSTAVCRKLLTDCGTRIHCATSSLLFAAGFPRGPS